MGELTTPPYQQSDGDVSDDNILTISANAVYVDAVNNITSA